MNVENPRSSQQADVKQEPSELAVCCGDAFRLSVPGRVAGRIDIHPYRGPAIDAVTHNITVVPDANIDVNSVYNNFVQETA